MRKGIISLKVRGSFVIYSLPNRLSFPAPILVDAKLVKDAEADDEKHVLQAARGRNPAARGQYAEVPAEA